MADQQDKRTASQRIEDLERTVMALYQTADSMAKDVIIIKDVIKLLGNKLESVAKASNLSDDVIAKLMVENNVKELEGKVASFVSQGILVASEELNDLSFVVGQELDEAGNVVNPRIQFALGSVDPELRDKIKTGKIGEAMVLQEGKLKLLITENYKIVTPEPPAATTAPQEVAPPADDAQAAAPTTEEAPADQVQNG